MTKDDLKRAKARIIANLGRPQPAPHYDLAAIRATLSPGTPTLSAGDDCPNCGHTLSEQGCPRCNLKLDNG